VEFMELVTNMKAHRKFPIVALLLETQGWLRSEKRLVLKGRGKPVGPVDNYPVLPFRLGRFLSNCRPNQPTRIRKNWRSGFPKSLTYKAVQVGLLTVYDMCKAVDRGMIIEQVMLLEKHGGKS